ncbi:type II toxin-antitoxin system VapC family toxin [Halomonas elongata]|uniref:type II toxin-antitoxin system VapC family toxin n=1 Tax=Halomonas elongata TaxID=2746 RepID=UPI00255AC823|nr:type II toxin-antitoxin system VapC family toxin [Halomonas elongata]MDL4860720.1 type II toxin-antitoxin system VapC family toxin [Halomonas elongata]
MIVLDTHALVWWVNGDAQLSQAALDTITRELEDDGEVLVSAITAWEIALLVEKERLSLSMNIDDWLDTVSEIDGVRFAPLDVATLVESTRLPGEFHKDPADRMIVSLARHLNVLLVTADNKIISYRHVRTHW